MIDQTRQYLADMPDLYAQLGAYLLPGSKEPDPEMRTATSSPARPPLVIDVIDLLDTREKDAAELTPSELIAYDRTADYRRLGILPTLRLWVSLVMDELIDQGEKPEVCCPHIPGTDHTLHTVSGEVGWLITHLDRILAVHPDFADDVRKLHQDLQRAVGERDPLTFYCPKCGWRVEPKDDNSWFDCTGCPETWVMDAEIQRMAATQPDMPLTQIAKILGRSLGTLQKWSLLGRILPVGRRGKTFLYDLERVRRVSEATEKRLRA